MNGARALATFVRPYGRARFATNTAMRFLTAYSSSFSLLFVSSFARARCASSASSSVVVAARGSSSSY